MIEVYYFLSLYILYLYDDDDYDVLTMIYDYTVEGEKKIYITFFVFIFSTLICVTC